MKLTAIFLLAASLLSAADPSTFATRKAKIRELLDKHDYKPALEQATAINREWPDDVLVYHLIAEANLGLGNYADAETAIQWMFDLRVGKADPQGWLLLGRFREVTGDLDGAIEAVNQGYSRSEPGHDAEKAALAAYSGHLYFVMGKLAFAEQALRSADRDPQARLTLAEIRIAQDKRDEGVAILREIASQAARPEYLYALAHATGARSDYENFERAARSKMDASDNSNRELVLYLAGAGARPAEALKLARQESIRRHDVYTQDSLAMAYWASKQTALATATMRAVLEVGTRDPQLLSHAALMGLKLP